MRHAPNAPSKKQGCRNIEEEYLIEWEDRHQSAMVEYRLIPIQPQ
jgi:hypothetical protein